jgi:heme-binding protein
MRVLRWAGIGILVVLAALQLVPYGRSHTNPPGRVEPPWDAPTTRALAVRACYDCHSNETVWPWYSLVAPMSWLLQRDVDEGRRKLNLSEWDRPQKEAREAAKTMRKGEMPPWFYTLVQRDARLTAEETTALVRGLEATLGTKDGKGRDD